MTQTPPPVASTPVPSLPADPGAVQGTFFTKADENDGAIVSQNVVAVSFAQDGSGAFRGMLDITYVDGTHILLNMSGPLNWSPTSLQVDATLQGTFTLDAPINSNDVTTTDASISISSLEAGSGALCATKCFGFTFPPVDIVAVRASATPSPLASATPAPVTLGGFGEVTVDTIDALLTAGNREASANEVFTAAIFDPAGVERGLVRLGDASCTLIEQVEGSWNLYSLGVAEAAAAVDTPFEDLTEFDLMEVTASVMCPSVYQTVES